MCRLKHRRLWRYWLALLVGSFGLMEYPAIKHHCHKPLSDTLSELHLGPAILVGGVILGVHIIRYPRSLEKENPAL